jgi:hypothetical protein
VSVTPERDDIRLPCLWSAGTLWRALLFGLRAAHGRRVPDLRPRNRPG